MTPLGELLRSRIEKDGPVPVHDFMKMALGHPELGYYAQQEPFGETGDFITAPEVSQMFGELIGLWAVDVWAKLGGPTKFHLVELGPGNGTLMTDILRSARIAPEFLSSVTIHLVETSARLRKKQADALADHNVTWHEELPTLSGAPVILLANEFFDALPIRQFVFAGSHWFERLVSWQNGGFEYTKSARPFDLKDAPEAKEGDIYERCPDGEAMIGRLSNLLRQEGGAALIIDYGAEDALVGDSFQAVRGHKPVNPLVAPGEADLTAHVKFAIFKKIALSQGVTVQGPTQQGRFLERLGIEARHYMLRKEATEAQKKKLDAQLRRLISAEEMGTLFKAMALSHNMAAAGEGFGN